MRKIGYIVMMLWCCTALSPVWAAVTGRDVQRAEQYFENEEWDIALKIYDQLLQTHPKEPLFYAAAIVAMEQNDTLANTLRYVEISQIHNISPDQLFKQVRTLSRQVGNPDIYTNLLLQVREEQPWYTNLINRYLLENYLFRERYGIAQTYVDELSQALPSSLSIRKAQAHIYMKQDSIPQAIACYRAILDDYPEDRDALLQLAVYHYRRGEAEFAQAKQEYNALDAPTKERYEEFLKKITGTQLSDLQAALRYLELANKLYPTPKVQRMLLDVYQIKQMWREARALRLTLQRQLL